MVVAGDDGRQHRSATVRKGCGTGRTCQEGGRASEGRRAVVEREKCSVCGGGEGEVKEEEGVGATGKPRKSAGCHLAGWRPNQEVGGSLRHWCSENLENSGISV